jgi:hypothetical protein
VKFVNYRCSKFLITLCQAQNRKYTTSKMFQLSVFNDKLARSKDKKWIV